MTRQLILALDQGTTSSRAILFDENLQELGHVSEAYEQYYPQNGWVEHEPEDLSGSIRRSLGHVMAEQEVQPGEITAIGITNQRETTLIWDRKTGKCIARAIVWQCRRTADICEKMKADGLEDYVKANTGLIIDPYFSGTKIKWLLDHVPKARERADRGELLFGTVDTYLLWKLTNGHVHATDYTNASRTMLFNIRTLDWDDRILDYLGIPRSLLPEVHPSGCVHGTCTWPIFGGAPVPVAGIAGDQQSALFGQGCNKPGEMKITYGTGAFLLLNAGNTFIQSHHGLLTTLGAGTRPGKPEYLLEGSVFMAGAIMQWLRDNLGILPDTSQSGTIAAQVPDTCGVCLVPAFTGLGAPHWKADARAALLGMTRATNYKHIIRAAEEAIAFQCHDLVKAMEQDIQQKITHIRVDGGASQDDFLMQFQANILDSAIERPHYIETTAKGAARLAMQTLGTSACHTHRPTIFTPRMAESARQSHLARWNQALETVLK